MGDFLLLAFIFLIAGVVAVPIAARLQLGSVLGYLLAGIAISPLLTTLNVDVCVRSALCRVRCCDDAVSGGSRTRARRRPLGDAKPSSGARRIAGGWKRCWAVAAIAFVAGQPWTISLAIGFILALSSTAIVLQTLNEKGLMRSDGGQSSFSVLVVSGHCGHPDAGVLFRSWPCQSLWMPRPIRLALMERRPTTAHLMAVAGHEEAGHGGGHGPTLSLVEGLSGWQQANGDGRRHCVRRARRQLWVRAPVFRFYRDGQSERAVYGGGRCCW